MHNLWPPTIGQDWITLSEHPMFVDVMDIPSIPEFSTLTSQIVSIAPFAYLGDCGCVPDFLSQSINMAKR